MRITKTRNTTSELSLMTAICFGLLWKNDISNLLDFFADDAVIYEPISVERSIKGKWEIEEFLKLISKFTRGATYKIRSAISLQSEDVKNDSVENDNAGIITIDFVKGNIATYQFFVHYEKLSADLRNSGQIIIPFRIKSIKMELID